jgi:hypothetical protein
MATLVRSLSAPGPDPRRQQGAVKIEETTRRTLYATSETAATQLGKPRRV